MDALQIKKEYLKRYFGDKPSYIELFGIGTFDFEWKDLEEKVEQYKEWHKINNPKYEIIDIKEVPKEIRMFYKIHYNLSGENYNRAKLANELMNIPLQETLNEILKRRAKVFDIEKFSSEVVYTSTIFRGKSQVRSGKWFEDKVQDVLEEPLKKKGFEIKNAQKYDKKILFDNKVVGYLEISFQVTGNSAMERKSKINTGENRVLFVFGGIGWLDRSSALNRCVPPEKRIDKSEKLKSPYEEVFGCTEGEFKRLKDYIIENFLPKNITNLDEFV